MSFPNTVDALAGVVPRAKEGSWLIGSLGRTRTRQHSQRTALCATVTSNPESHDTAGPFPLLWEHRL